MKFTPRKWLRAGVVKRLRRPAAALGMAAAVLTGTLCFAFRGGVHASADASQPISRYALQGVADQGTLPGGSGPNWYYQAANFIDPAAAAPENTDEKAWPSLTHSGWGVSYAFHNDDSKRSIACTLNDDGNGYYGISFSYRATEQALHDLAWALIIKAGSAAGTLHYRAVKVSGDETVPLWENGWKSQAYSSEEDEVLSVPVLRADLDVGDSVAIQAYFVGKNSTPGTMTIELGSPAATTVVRDEAGAVTYSAKSYFPAMRADGAGAYIPVSDRMIYEGVFFRSVLDNNAALEPFQVQPYRTITEVSPKERSMRAVYKQPDGTEESTLYTATRWYDNKSESQYSGPQCIAGGMGKLEPPDAAPGEKIYTGFQIRFLAGESGRLTVANTNTAALYSQQYLRVLHKNGVTGVQTVISQKTAQGDWTGGVSPAAGLKASVKVAEGDEILVQYCRTAGNTNNIGDISFTIEPNTATPYALQGVSGSAMPDEAGPCWFYQAGDFTETPDAPALAYMDSREWPHMTHTAWNTQYTLYNDNAKRSIAYTMQDTGADTYGMSFSYKAQEDAVFDFAWALIAKAGAPAGTLHYRVVKISGDTITPLWEDNWRTRTYDAALADDDRVAVPPIRAALSKGDILAIQAYFKAASPTGGSLTIELGSPSVVTVDKNDKGVVQYGVKTYFPTLFADGNTDAGAYIPVSSRFVYEGVSYKKDAHGHIVQHQVMPMTQLSNTGDNQIRSAFPENTAKNPGLSLGAAQNNFQMLVVAPWDNGGDVTYYGTQVRFIAEESGLATITLRNNLSGLQPENNGKQLARLLLNGRVISTGTESGGWSYNASGGKLTATALVEPGDELTYQFCQARFTNPYNTDMGDLTVEVIPPEPTRYALKGVNGSLPSDILGPCWYYHAADFSAEADKPVLEFTDHKAWPDMTHTAWGSGYTFYNSAAKRSIAAALNDTGNGKYGISFSYKAQEKAPHDLAWTLIAKAGAPAGTLFYRAVKVAGGTVTPLWENNWESVHLPAVLAEDQTIEVPPLRAALDAGDSIAIQAYFSALDSSGGRMTVELGSPSVMPVHADEDGRVTYSARTYFPTAAADGAVPAPNYIPVHDRFTYGAIYLKLQPDGSKEVFATGGGESLSASSVGFGNPFQPESRPSILFNGTNNVNWQFSPTPPMTVGDETIWSGIEVRFTVPDDGVAYIRCANQQTMSNGCYLRVLHNGSLLAGGGDNGNWKSGGATVNPRVVVKAGDVLSWQYYSERDTNARMYNFKDILVDLEPLTDENDPNAEKATGIYAGLSGDMLAYFKGLAEKMGNVAFNQDPPPTTTTTPSGTTTGTKSTSAPPSRPVADTSETTETEPEESGATSKKTKATRPGAEEEESGGYRVIRRRITIMPTWAIVLISVGGVLAAGGLVFLLIRYRRKKRHAADTLDNGTSEQPGGNPPDAPGGTV